MRIILGVLSLSILFIICQQCAFVDRYEYKETSIQLDQIGYLTQAKKMAVIVAPVSDSFTISDPEGVQKYRGRLIDKMYWDKSGKEVGVADFSSFKEKGQFILSSQGSKSPVFSIQDDIYIDLLKGAIKAYYYNRASSALETKYAGAYKRGFSHPDTAVLIHSTAASKMRPAGKKISTPYGWYDAGDYNKYIVNSGITTYSLLSSYQHNKPLFDTLTWNIPESTNNIPDILDEILWNVRWMESMQDPNDGGVYHKTTTASFEKFVFPTNAKATRFVTAKGTAATLDFCAVLAKASYVLRPAQPEYSTELLQKAEKAWGWAIKNTNVPFKNPYLQDSEYPSISTGEYGDRDFSDEFFWAACELYLATGKSMYLDKINFDGIEDFRVPSWNSVESLGLISLASTKQNLPVKTRKQASDQLLMMAESLMTVWQNSPYKITLNNFQWGSNSDILNQAMILLNAFRIFGNNAFYEASLSDLDYVLGRNAVGYCFVTGFGTTSPLHIHHRQSASDNVEAPVPGFLVGGPNPRNVEEDCGSENYPSMLPALCYLDDVCSYSTNEVAINWNAPLVYVTSSLQSIYLQHQIHYPN